MNRSKNADDDGLGRGNASERSGHQHFIRAHADEAAAALLGVELPGDGSADIVLSKSLVKVLQTYTAAQGAGIKAGAMAEFGIPPQVSGLVVDQLVKAQNRVISRLGFKMPKSWDIDNTFVTALIAARRKTVS